MRITKIVIGVLSIILAAYMLALTAMLGVVSIFSKPDSISTIMLIISFCFLAAGITSLAGSRSNGASVACFILYIIAAFIGVFAGRLVGMILLWTAIAVLCALTYLGLALLYKPELDG